MPNPNDDRRTAHVRIPPPQSDEFRQRMRLVQDRFAGQLQPTSELPRRWAPALLFITLIGFFYLTVFPFDFTLHTGQTFDFRAVDPSDYSDWGMNVLLGLPVGFALAALGAGRGWSKLRMFLLAGGATCICSTIVECLQLFLPGRVSALADILANTTGGLAGCLLFLPIGRDSLSGATRAARFMRRRVAGAAAPIVLAAVVGLVCAVPAYLLRWPRLAVWNAEFPLLVGNENNAAGEGFRQWSGTLSGLAIADRAATAEQSREMLAHGNFSAIMQPSIVADYPLLGPGPYADASHHLPDLAWVLQPPAIAPGAPAHCDEHHFLSTRDRAAMLVNAITASDSFTICFTAATDDTAQLGPARLLTCSRSIMSCNFMLGQQGADLIIRLRTRGTGANGDCPEWVVPNIFRDRLPHLLLISYDGNILRVYQDSLQRYWRVRTPTEYALMRKFLARDQLTMPINGTGNLMFVGLFYVVCLIPIAAVLGIILSSAVYPPATVVRPPPLWYRLIFPTFGLLLSVAALYVTVDRLGIRAMGWTEFPLSAFLLAIETAIFGHWWAHGPARARSAPPMAQVMFVGDASDFPGK